MTHMKGNHAAQELTLTQEDMGALDRIFPPPDTPRMFEMIRDQVRSASTIV
jgi:diketogulonate reductase-like aldo/keto reductase